MGIEQINLEPSRSKSLEISYENGFIKVKALGIRESVIALLMQSPDRSQRILPVKLEGDSGVLSFDDIEPEKLEGTYILTGFNIPSNALMI